MFYSTYRLPDTRCTPPPPMPCEVGKLGIVISSLFSKHRGAEQPAPGHLVLKSRAGLGTWQSVRGVPASPPRGGSATSPAPVQATPSTGLWSLQKDLSPWGHIESTFLTIRLGSDSLSSSMEITKPRGLRCGGWREGERTRQIRHNPGPGKFSTHPFWTGQKYEWRPTFHMSKYLKVINQVNKLLNKICPILLG